jgi:Mg-chelatase subunit ChlI
MRWSSTPTAGSLYTIAALTASFKVDGRRADIVILKTARAQAALDSRLQIDDKDILLAAELALPHRMKKQPFQDSMLHPSSSGPICARPAPKPKRSKNHARRGSQGDCQAKKKHRGRYESELNESSERGEGAAAQPDASPQQSSSPGDNKGARKTHQGRRNLRGQTARYPP